MFCGENVRTSLNHLEGNVNQLTWLLLSNMIIADICGDPTPSFPITASQLTIISYQ